MSQQQDDDDDDGTIIRPRTVAPALSPGVTSTGPLGEAGPSASAEDGLSLRIGARVGEFEITQRIGEGGFSIVYLAMDHSLERTVALKEYMPSSLATRVGTIQVQPRSQRYRDTFEAGLKSFVNEAKLLAHFDHPSLVKVYRFWEANGTAYMVMPFYQGVTLKDTIRALPEPPDEAWLTALLAPLTEALLVIHAEHCYHRDVAPDNVLLLAASGKPLLLDFGAARRVIGDMTQALTVILKAGYAPVEQYAEVPGMKQGPWTDVYALAAVVYWAITGSTPPASVGRMMSDSFVPLAERAAGRYSLRFLQTIDRALVVLPEKRTQTIDAFRQELGLTGVDPSSPPRPMQWNDPEATVIRPPASKSRVSADQNTGRMGSTLRPAGATPGPATSARLDLSDMPDRSAGVLQPAQAATPGPARGMEARHADESLQPRQATPRKATASAGPPEAARTKSGHLRTLLAVSALGAAVVAAGIWWALQGPSEEMSRAAPDGAKAIVPVPQVTAKPGAADSPVVAEPIVDPRPTSPLTIEPTATLAPPVVTEAAKPTPAAPVSPIESTPATPPTLATKQSAPTAKVTAQPNQQSTRNPQRAEPDKSERRPADLANNDECNRIVQRLSLGESSPELIERLKTLKCR